LSANRRDWTSRGNDRGRGREDHRGRGQYGRGGAYGGYSHPWDHKTDGHSDDLNGFSSHLEELETDDMKAERRRAKNRERNKLKQLEQEREKERLREKEREKEHERSKSRRKQRAMQERREAIIARRRGEKDQNYPASDTEVVLDSDDFDASDEQDKPSQPTSLSST